MAVHGEVADALGPIPSAKVSVRIERAGGSLQPDHSSTDASETADSAEQHPKFQRFVRTDQSGKFRVSFDGDELRDGLWRAHMVVVPDAGPEVAVPTEPLELDRTSSRILLDMLGIVGLLGLVALFGQRLWQVLYAHFKERRRRAKTREQAARAFADDETIVPVHMSQEVDLGEPSASDRSVWGVVWDRWRDEPMQHAELTVVDLAGDEVVETSQTDASAGQEGRFSVGPLEAGQYRLEVRADGFMPGRLDFETPHSGRLGNVRLDLVAVPLKIRRLYQSLVEALQGDDLWGRLSPREIEDVLLEAADRAQESVPGMAGARFVERLRRRLDAGDQPLGGHELVAMMTALVEETYFSGRQFDESVWHVARDIALQLRTRFEEEAR